MRRFAWILAVTAFVLLLLTAVSATVAWLAVGRTWFGLDHRLWWVLAALLAVAGFLVWLFRTALRWPWGSPWRVHVLAAADALEHQLDALPAGRASAERQLRSSIDKAVRHHLRIARNAAWPSNDQRLPVGQQLVDWWTGAPCEASYVNLHEAEIALARLLPDDQIRAGIPEALARLQTMDLRDPRRRAAETQLVVNSPRSQLRAEFQSAVRTGLELKDQQHARLRSFRNVLFIATAGLTVLVIAVCVVGAWKPDALPICFGPETATAPGPRGVACPSEERPPSPGDIPRRLPAPGDVTLVALLGLLGGGLSAAVAIRRLQGTSTPYEVPVALSLLKLPSGALSALIGLLFVRGEFIPGLSQLDSQPQILAYAFLFGIAQQLVTGLVDRQAQDIMGKVPSKEPVTAQPDPPPAQGSIQRPGWTRRWRR